MSKLLIVESPTKARTISRMLGKDYNIIASMGHVRDLPEHALGIDIGNGFQPSYVDTARSRSVLKELRAAAADADEIFLATDPDREGEAIAWHLQNALTETMKKPKPFRRITFHEITRQAVENAIANSGEIDRNLVDAQQARRVLDRIVGYQVSPLLWRKLEKGSSAGRVQSAALRMVVERERAIGAFKPKEYWVFSVLFNDISKAAFSGRLFKIDKADFDIDTQSGAEAAEQAVRNGSTPMITNVSRQERKRNPYPPYTTSTLQQSANQLLHYTASSTMRYAQQLYEGVDIGGETIGLITYMRTDSVTIAKEAQLAARDFISQTYGAEYVPEKFNVYKNKAAAQEAHEAIRPTDVRRTPEMVSGSLDAAQLKLYTLIWKRFVASQMAHARQELMTVDVNVSGADGREYLFRSTATATIFPGFMVLASGKTEKDDGSTDTLKSLSAGTPCTIVKFDKEQKFTEPPPRFTEASLIKQLEENGIGRPSTYATILRTIQERDYVAREQGKLLPTELGFTVNDFLVEKLPELSDIGFTAQMEQRLDDVEAGAVGWTEMMTDFYARFSPWVAAAKNSGAPPEENARIMLQLLEGVTFEPPQKISPRRVFDDGKFVNSIKEKFARKPLLSEKQYQSLLALAAKYRSQLPPRQELPPEIADGIDEAVAEMERKAESLKQRPPAPSEGYAPVFAAFDNVTFPAAKSGARSFDEGKFFKSLKQQALGGAALSEKQLAALKRMAIKYRSQLIEPEKLFALLQITEVPAAAESDEAQAAVDVDEVLAFLATVKNWVTPVKRGRFTFDDKKFYQSVAKQHRDGKVLSDKQINALAKLAAKYRGQENKDEVPAAK